MFGLWAFLRKKEITQRFAHMKKERNKLRLRLEILEQKDRRLVDSLEMLDDASSNIYEQIIETTKAPQKILAPH